MGDGVLYDIGSDVKRMACLVKEVALHDACFVVGHFQQSRNTDLAARLERAQEAHADTVVDEAAVKVFDKGSGGIVALRCHGFQAGSTYVERLTARGYNVAGGIDGAKLQFPPADGKPRKRNYKEAHPRRVLGVKRRKRHFPIRQGAIGESLAQRQRIGNIAIGKSIGRDAGTRFGGSNEDHWKPLVVTGNLGQDIHLIA